MSTTYYTDGTGLRSSEPLPELDAALLEEVVAWATWDYETRDLFAHSHPEMRKYLENIPMWGQEAWCVSNDDVTAKDDNVCRTSFCIAGYTMYATGHVKHIVLTDPDEIAKADGWDSASQMRASGCSIPDSMIRDRVTGMKDILADDENDPDEWEQAWSEGAQKLLGLTSREANWMFHGDNSLERIQHLAQQIAKSRDLPKLNFDNWTFTRIKDSELDMLFSQSMFSEIEKEDTST